MAPNRQPRRDRGCGSYKPDPPNVWKVGHSFSKLHHAFIRAGGKEKDSQRAAGTWVAYFETLAAQPRGSLGNKSDSDCTRLHRPPRTTRPISSQRGVKVYLARWPAAAGMQEPKRRSGSSAQSSRHARTWHRGYEARVLPVRIHSLRAAASPSHETSSSIDRQYVVPSSTVGKPRAGDAGGPMELDKSCHRLCRWARLHPGLFAEELWLGRCEHPS